MTSKTSVALIIPNLEDLYLINCKVNPAALKDPIIKSLFHCQILTCRLIIRTIKCCIASPSIQNVGDSVHVIVSKKFFYKGKLQKYLFNLKIQFNDPVPVHSRIYVACLKYTFTFKLTPLWNSVGKYCLRTSNFLPLKSGIDALEWNIFLKANYSKLEIIPMMLNLSPLSLECLPLTPTILDNFITNPNSHFDTIDLTLFQFPWVYVLPKLTRAKIVSISRILPTSCPFENYNDLRRHWKNMYSYRLPKTEKDMLFYEVVFSLNSKERFTYPEVCILFKKPEVLLSVDRDEIANKFITALHSKVHSVCNEVIKIGHLLPGWNTEYPYPMKRKRNNYGEVYSSELKTPFFKIPGYIIKLATEKDNLSSIEAFKGSDKMSKYMQNHSQLILSIMQNQPRKMVPTVQNNIMKKSQSQYIIPAIINTEKDYKSNTRNKNSVEYSLLLQQRRTPINNVNNIFSYYNSASMYPKTCGNSSTINLKNDFDSNQFYNQNPTMKKVESVRFDLTGFKKNTKAVHDNNHSILKFDERLEKSKEYNQDCIIQNLYYETNYTTPCNTLNPYNKTTDNFYKHKLKVSNSIIRSNISLQNKKLFHNPLDAEEQTLGDGKSESDNELRAQLSKFDQLYKMHHEDENEKSEYSEFDYDLIKTLGQEPETPEFNKNVKSPYILNSSKEWSNRNQNIHCHETTQNDNFYKHNPKVSNSIIRSNISLKNKKLFHNPLDVEKQTLGDGKSESDNELRAQLSKFNQLYKMHHEDENEKSEYSEFDYDLIKTLCQEPETSESNKNVKSPYILNSSKEWSNRNQNVHCGETIQNDSFTKNKTNFFESGSKKIMINEYEENIQPFQEHYNYSIEKKDKCSSNHLRCPSLIIHSSNASQKNIQESQEQKSYYHNFEQNDKYSSSHSQCSPLILHSSNASLQNIKLSQEQKEFRCDHTLYDNKIEKCYKSDSLSLKIHSGDQTEKKLIECTQKFEEFDILSFYKNLKANLFNSPESLNSISYLNSEGFIKKKFKQEHTSPALTFDFQHEKENKSKSSWQSLKKAFETSQKSYT